MHIPVLLKEAIEYLNLKEGDICIDCTVGRGGYLREMAKKVGLKGKVLGIDADGKSLKEIEIEIEKNKELKNVILKQGNFSDMREIMTKAGLEKVNGIVMDLGLSSWQFEASGRGFSFKNKELLDMRFDDSKGETAADIVNVYPESELVKIFKEYGEENFSGRIAREIIERRKVKKIETAQELAEIIFNAVPGRFRHGKIHPATRVFQALRIAVNNELENLKIGLAVAEEMLVVGGRLVVISFHSLEDRIVKNFFRDRAKEGFLEILTKKPIVPSEKESTDNPRSRSAKLRVALKK